MEAMKAQSAPAQRVRKAVCAGPLPSSSSPPPLHRVAAKHHCTNVAKHKILTKLFWISWYFVKFLENFLKHEIKYFAKLQKQTFLQPPYSSTICLQLHKLPSAKTIFCCAAMLLWDEADICTVVFHSVIFNSVGNNRIFMVAPTASHIQYQLQLCKTKYLCPAKRRKNISYDQVPIVYKIKQH